MARRSECAGAKAVASHVGCLPAFFAVLRPLRSFSVRATVSTEGRERILKLLHSQKSFFRVIFTLLCTLPKKYVHRICFSICRESRPSGKIVRSVVGYVFFLLVKHGTWSSRRKTQHWKFKLLASIRLFPSVAACSGRSTFHHLFSW